MKQQLVGLMAVVTLTVCVHAQPPVQQVHPLTKVTVGVEGVGPGAPPVQTLTGPGWVSLVGQNGTFSLSDATPGLYRVEIFNRGPGAHRSNHAFVSFASVWLLMPADWTVQYATEMGALDFGPWVDGRRLWMLVNGTPSVTKFSHGKFPVPPSPLNRLEGGQKATWIIGPTSLANNEFPNPISPSILDNAVKKFLKVPINGSVPTGFPMLDAAKAAIIRSNGRVQDSLLTLMPGQVRTMGSWMYNSHALNPGWNGPGGAPTAAGFRTWMHFGNTPAGAFSRGGTNGRYESAAWMLENYVAMPSNIDSYRLALQMVRNQVSHGFVWTVDDSGQTPDYFGLNRRYEKSTQDFAGDWGDAARSHNWGAEWWLLYAMSNDPLVRAGAEALTNRIVTFVMGNGCFLNGNYWTEGEDSRILEIGLRNLYAGWLVTGNVAYSLAAQTMINEAMDIIDRVIPMQGNRPFIPRVACDNSGGQNVYSQCLPWQDVRAFSAMLDWFDEGVGSVSQRQKVYRMIQYNADNFADFWTSSNGEMFGRIGFLTHCGPCPGQPCIGPIPRPAQNCIDLSLPTWNGVTANPYNGTVVHSSSTQNSPYAIYPYYRLARDGGAILGLTPAQRAVYEERAKAMARSSYQYLGIFDWSNIQCVANSQPGCATVPAPVTPEFVGQGSAPAGSGFFSGDIPFKDWGRLLYGARPLTLNDLMF